ncbi:MAG: hypothetical protein ACD_81C00087G0003 [uncultured bacterium]|uniref:Uncharacterized protein n=1 Tax=Candidatus Wolfebacteria bacterium GW2011_GWE2_44_13 TaxID=1619017 RepID=A0A0G1HAV8_9BACT|nr:MAG: hypothetical protein ACD_81C00087G0003 [uncultured bacterium]KKT43643.1 MAG: hypothetical protein UW32_C0001G0235 [Candidatus Wolfebacteria bacterium GW2011_GWE2_44_13]
MDNQNFEAATPETSQIESDLNRVKQAVHEQTGGSATPEVTERALVRQSLQPMVNIASTPAPTQQTHAAADDAMLPEYLKDASPEIKDRVERLVEDAFANGVEHAAIAAQAFGPFVVDALHDALSDRFYEELQKRKFV